MIAVAVALSLVVGAVLGLLGGGGSILMLPVLVYVVGLSPGDGVALSLLVVGATSAAALLPHARAGRVQLRVGLLFGAAGMAGAYAGGRVSPLLPGWLLLVGFAVLMLGTAIAMLRRKRESTKSEARKIDVPRSLLYGAGVGVVAGLIGAGGGFLVVPALVLLGGLPIRTAIATSLLVIAMQSAAGFVTHLGHAHIDWSLAIGTSIAAVGGSLLGARFSARVPQARLRKGFAWLVLALGSFMLFQQSRAALAAAGVSVMALSDNLFWLKPLAGGAIIGIAAALLWLVNGRVSGISGIVGGLSTATGSDRLWRLTFLLGLLSGGVLLSLFVPSAFETSHLTLGLAVVAGLLVGVGTTIGNGCTSGHGVCGISRLSKRSLAATGTFIGAGMLTVFVVRHLIGGLS